MAVRRLTNHFTYQVELLQKPQYYLAAVAVFSDEARFLKEWIEFNKLMGVEHFYLYNHKSTDNYAEVLTPYVMSGLVDITNVTGFIVDHGGTLNIMQSNVYKHAIDRTKDKVEWLMIGDTDEFMHPVKGKNLPEVLKNYEDSACLSVNWRNFGSNGVDKLLTNETLIEKMLMRGSYDPLDDVHVKSIVKPRYVETIINQHFPVLKPGYAQMTEKKQTFYGPFTHFPSNEIITINHYWARDWEFFNSTKITRVHLVETNLSEQHKNIKIQNLITKNKQCSTIYDDSILKFAPALREQLFGVSHEETICDNSTAPDLMGCANETASSI